MLDQLTTLIAAGGEAEIRAVINFDTLAMAEITVDMLKEVHEAQPQEVQAEEFAPIIGYIVQQGDTLWSIAKHYRVPRRTVREINGMKTDEIIPGMKLILLKQP